MKIACVCIDQKFSDEDPAVAPHILKRLGDNAAKAGHEVGFYGPYKDGLLRVVSDHCDAVWMFPAWHGLKESRVKGTRKVLGFAKAYNIPVVIVNDDPQCLFAHQRTVRDLGVEVAICTNFKTVERLWTLPSEHFFVPYPPVDQMYDFGEKPPKFDVGYVGCFKPKRWAILQKVDYPITLMGPAWDKQDKFPFAFKGLTKFKYLQEVYASAAWHVSIQDDWQGQLTPSISRFAEAWRCRRPVLIHESHVRLRPDIDWKWAMPWVWTDAEDIRRILAEYGCDLPGLHSVARTQEEALFDQMYVRDADPTDLIHYCERKSR